MLECQYKNPGADELMSRRPGDEATPRLAEGVPNKCVGAPVGRSKGRPKGGMNPCIVFRIFSSLWQPCTGNH